MMGIAPGKDIDSVTIQHRAEEEARLQSSRCLVHFHTAPRSAAQRILIGILECEHVVAATEKEKRFARAEERMAPARGGDLAFRWNARPRQRIKAEMKELANK